MLVGGGGTGTWNHSEPILSSSCYLANRNARKRWYPSRQRSLWVTPSVNFLVFWERQKKVKQERKEKKKTQTQQTDACWLAQADIDHAWIFIWRKRYNARHWPVAISPKLFVAVLARLRAFLSNYLRLRFAYSLRQSKLSEHPRLGGNTCE